VPVADVRSPAVPVQPSAVREVEVMLDRPRRLRYDLNALALIEERYGDAGPEPEHEAADGSKRGKKPRRDPLDRALDAFQSGSPAAIRFLLYAGLVHEDETLTERQVGAMFTLADLASLGQRINEAISAGLPQPDPNAERPPEMAGPEGSTGPGSTTPAG